MSFKDHLIQQTKSLLILTPLFILLYGEVRISKPTIDYHYLFLKGLLIAALGVVIRGYCGKVLSLRNLYELVKRVYCAGVCQYAHFVTACLS
jgi:hypothetical protein